MSLRTRLQVGDTVAVRGKRAAFQKTARAAQLLEPDYDGPGFVDDDGETFRLFYFDIKVIDPNEHERHP